MEPSGCIRTHTIQYTLDRYLTEPVCWTGDQQRAVGVHPDPHKLIHTHALIHTHLDEAVHTAGDQHGAVEAHPDPNMLTHNAPR